MYRVILTRWLYGPSLGIGNDVNVWCVWYYFRHYQRIFQLLSSTSCLEEMEFAALSKPNSVVQSYHKHSTATVDKVGTVESNNNDMKMTNDGYHSVAQSEDMTQTINQSEDMVTDDAEKFYGRSLSRCSVKSRANSVRSQRFSRASVKSQTSCVESSAHPTPVRHRLPRAGRQRIYVHRSECYHAFIPDI